MEKLDGGSLDIVQKNIAKLKEKYGTDDLMRVVFRDNDFKDAEPKTNGIQILKQCVIIIKLQKSGDKCGTKY